MDEVCALVLIWLNLVCLDAPLVAVAWQWLFGHSLQVAVSTPARLALFLTAWLIYLGDRFAGAIALSDDTPKSMREAFCRKHRQIWLGLISIVAVLDGLVVFCCLDPENLRRGIFLAAVAAIYLAINFRFSKVWRIFPIKEVCVGFLFAAGTLLALAPQLHLAGLTIDFAAVIFACLCALNCISIAVWERDLDFEQHRDSIATKFPRIRKGIDVLLILLLCCSAALGFVNSDLRGLAVCLGTSSLALLSLHFLSVARDTRTALADLVLLTPLALFVIDKLR